MEDTKVLVMAGGAGTRFWPKSRRLFPKQFLSLFGDQSMLQMTANRFLKCVDADDVMVVSTDFQTPLIREQLPWIKQENLIREPVGRNTAPCIALSALHIRKKNPNAIMVVTPADHLITETDRFSEIIAKGVKIVRENPLSLVTLGIEPRYPATSYGYIQKGDIFNSTGGAYHVRTFAEKPDRETADKFFETKEFLWNSGIFIWNVNTILDAFEEFMPDLWQALERINANLGEPREEKVTNEEYSKLLGQSIDYGVLEHASQVVVLESDFGWSDVGSWEEVYNISDKDENGNVVKGEAVLKDVSNTLIESTGRQVSVVGVKDLIIVDSDDALLICNRERSQDVKWVTEHLRQNGNEKYL